MSSIAHECISTRRRLVHVGFNIVVMYAWVPADIREYCYVTLCRVFQGDMAQICSRTPKSRKIIWRLSECLRIPDLLDYPMVF